MNEKLPIGTIVVLKNGSREIRVTGYQCYHNYKPKEYEGRYLHSEKLVGFDHYQATVIQEKNKKMKIEGTLFEVKGSDNVLRYGVGLATNSENKIVLDMKDTKLPEAFEKDDIKEVLPYTVALVPMSGSNNSYKKQVISSPGKVQVGDIILLDKLDDVYRVDSIDTKARGTTTVLKGRKLKTENI